MNKHEDIPFTDPLIKDYEYFFPSASWERQTDNFSENDKDDTKEKTKSADISD